MYVITFFQQQPLIYLVYMTCLGLIIGSFLNVVIHRLPLMLERQWRKECDEYLNYPQRAESPASTEPFNLATPKSHCPQCHQGLRAWHIVPVLSYLLLQGRCAYCRVPISPRYPLVELLTGGITLIVAWHFGPTGQMLAALILSWALITLSFIDFDHQLLPDAITQPLLWLGLGLSVFDVFDNAHASILGAFLGYLSLWSMYHIFRLLTGKEGMGYGDFKLFALLGAWLGWQSLLLIILLASISGAVLGTALMFFRKYGRDTPIPFGPFLAIAGWVALLWGVPLNRWLLSF